MNLLAWGQERILLTAIAVARVSSFSRASFFSAGPHKALQRGPHDTLRLGGFCYRREILSWGNPSLSQRTSAYFPLLRRKTLSRPFSKAVHYRNILKKIVQKAVSISAPKPWRNLRNPWRIASQQEVPVAVSSSSQMCKNSSLPWNGPAWWSWNKGGFWKKRLKPGKKEHGRLKNMVVYLLGLYVILTMPSMFIWNSTVLPVGCTCDLMVWLGSCSPIPKIISSTNLLQCLELPPLQSFSSYGIASRRTLYNFVLLYGRDDATVPLPPLIYPCTICVCSLWVLSKDDGFNGRMGSEEVRNDE